MVMGVAVVGLRLRLRAEVGWWDSSTLPRVLTEVEDAGCWEFFSDIFLSLVCLCRSVG
jgi:hypothetical protein